jgi:8-oxo-dGTP pyrophosphatase MutT (NUDIX family)
MIGAVSHRPTLDELIPAGMFLGTSLILRSGGRFLYGIRVPPVQEERAITPSHQGAPLTTLELTGIGGRMEATDASFFAGAAREAWEEIGCAVRWLCSRETLVVRGPGQTDRLALVGPEHPAAVVFRHYRTPPHQPWHGSNRGQACVIVFVAELESGRPSASLPGSTWGPWPVGELPALVWLTAEQVVATARQDVPLSQLLDGGATLVEDRAGLVPRDALARLTDSQEALVLGLAEAALAFYEGCLQLGEEF